MQVADIVIVGGGPSGAATALSLAREGLVVSDLRLRPGISRRNGYGCRRLLFNGLCLGEAFFPTAA